MPEASELHLVCHPDTPAAWLTAVRVRVTPSPGGALELAYTLGCDLARLRLPPPAPPKRMDDLWRHTCCEAFVMGEDAPAYREFNLSPAGPWQAYAFRGYRDGGRPAPAADPCIAWQAGPASGILTAHLARSSLPPGNRLRLGLAVVAEDQDGRLSYWALRHPPGRPDFHHTDAFALEIALPAMRPAPKETGR